MIKAVLIFNNSGKARLMKFYEFCPEEKQQDLLREIFQILLKRDENVCQFLETVRWSDENDCRLIYRHYATLYFVFCVDKSESELGILDLIQVFVETLDKLFENVCELDLVFHLDKVQFVLQEFCLGGLVIETDSNEVLRRLDEQNHIEKQETGSSAAKTVSALKDLNLTQKLREMKVPQFPLNFRF